MLHAKESGGGHALYVEARSLPNGDPRKAGSNRKMIDLYSDVVSRFAPDWKALAARALP